MKENQVISKGTSIFTLATVGILVVWLIKLGTPGQFSWKWIFLPFAIEIGLSIVLLVVFGLVYLILKRSEK